MVHDRLLELGDFAFEGREPAQEPRPCVFELAHPSQRVPALVAKRRVFVYAFWLRQVISLRWAPRPCATDKGCSDTLGTRGKLTCRRLVHSVCQSVASVTHAAEADKWLLALSSTPCHHLLLTEGILFKDL